MLERIELGEAVMNRRGDNSMRMLSLFVLITCFMLMVACSPIENQARDTAAALAGSIAAAQSKYQAMCIANPGQQICQLINRGVSAQNALVTAVETYCGWSAMATPEDPKAACVPVKSAEGALKIAVVNASTLTAEIKGAI